MKFCIQRIITVSISLLFLIITACREKDKPSQQSEPLKVIFDTDMGPDYDDVGAIAMLHAFADADEAEILATMASTKYEGVAAVLNVLNTYFQRPDLPIGVPKGDAVTQRDFQHWSDTLIARYAHKINRNDEVPDAVSLYRQVLAKQPDSSVTIITVGFLTNIANLLKSSPDDYSPLSGNDLVHRKVKKLVCMAGKFPEGMEFNIEEDAAAAKYTFENFKNPILFSGFEIGHKIKSGIPLIQNDKIESSPVKDVFRISIPLAREDSAGRMSWDQTAVLAGIKGPDPFYKLDTGRIIVDENGYNRWSEEAGNHTRLVEQRDPSEVQRFINDLMMHQPQE
jgi:pyrimidine-specific ribonucleoside hydrolase